MALGGKREGAGRKSKAEELQLSKLIEDVIGEDGKKELISKIYEQSKGGSFPHQQLLMNYMFGKPKEKVDADVLLEQIISFKDAE
jgi:hypothetical protein